MSIFHSVVRIFLNNNSNNYIPYSTQHSTHVAQPQYNDKETCRVRGASIARAPRFTSSRARQSPNPHNADQMTNTFVIGNNCDGWRGHTKSSRLYTIKAGTWSGRPVAENHWAWYVSYSVVCRIIWAAVKQGQKKEQQVSSHPVGQLSFSGIANFPLTYDLICVRKKGKWWDPPIKKFINPSLHRPTWSPNHRTELQWYTKQ